MSNTLDYNKDDLNKVLDKLYQCRNLEISNLWQRSVFLSTFMLLIFSSYGFIFIKTLDAVKYDFLLNTIAALICSLGVLFSMLWIMMSKSSKAWYEVYEVAITNFENEYSQILGLPQNYIMGEMLGGKNDSNLFSANGGSFSPSKINIVLGQVSFSIFSLLSIIYSGIFIYKEKCIFILYMTIFIIIQATLCYFVYRSCKSSFLNKKIHLS